MEIQGWEENGILPEDDGILPVFCPFSIEVIFMRKS